jgi:hypothetical protein
MEYQELTSLESKNWLKNEVQMFKTEEIKQEYQEFNSLESKNWLKNEFQMFKTEDIKTEEITHEFKEPKTEILINEVSSETSVSYYEDDMNVYQLLLEKSKNKKIKQQFTYYFNKACSKCGNLEHLTQYCNVYPCSDSICLKDVGYLDMCFAEAEHKHMALVFSKQTSYRTLKTHAKIRSQLCPSKRKKSHSNFQYRQILRKVLNKVALPPSHPTFNVIPTLINGRVCDMANLTSNVPKAKTEFVKNEQLIIKEEYVECEQPAMSDDYVGDIECFFSLEIYSPPPLP